MGSGSRCAPGRVTPQCRRGGIRSPRGTRRGITMHSHHHSSRRRVRLVLAAAALGAATLAVAVVAAATAGPTTAAAHGDHGGHTMPVQEQAAAMVATARYQDVAAAEA